MGWENRGATAPYYYRKVRDADGRVRSVYVGKGLNAECMAEMDGAGRAARRYYAEAVRQTDAILDGAGEATEALTGAVKARLDAHLSGLGFMYHRGSWRRPRAAQGSNSAEPRPAAQRPQPEDDRALRLPSPTPSTRQVKGTVEEAGEPLQSDFLPRAAEGLSPADARVQSLRREAWGLRVVAERALMQGEGHKGNPVFRAYTSTSRSLVEGWGGIVAEPVDPDDESPLERRRRDGRVALGRTSASRPHSGSAAETALAVAAVLDEVGQDGRDAVRVVLERIRGEMGWASAAPLGRVIIDQYALARAHADIVAAFDEGSASERARQQGLQSPQEPNEHDALIDSLTSALGPPGATLASRARRDAYDATPSPVKVWKLRTRRTRRRLADADRLVRHARMAGLILSGPSSRGTGSSGASTRASDDPFTALTTPAPLDPLRGEAAETAAALRAWIDAQRAAWPPPDVMKWDDLADPSCPWSVFDYTVSETDPDGKPAPEFVWAARCHPPEHPDESLASLARWAPEYAEPLTSDLATLRGEAQHLDTEVASDRDGAQESAS